MSIPTFIFVKVVDLFLHKKLSFDCAIFDEFYASDRKTYFILIRLLLTIGFSPK